MVPDTGSKNTRVPGEKQRKVVSGAGIYMVNVGVGGHMETRRPRKEMKDCLWLVKF